MRHGKLLKSVWDTNVAISILLQLCMQCVHVMLACILPDHTPQGSFIPPVCLHDLTLLLLPLLCLLMPIEPSSLAPGCGQCLLDSWRLGRAVQQVRAPRGVLPTSTWPVVIQAAAGQ
jgi:hypothetical protein